MHAAHAPRPAGQARRSNHGCVHGALGMPGCFFELRPIPATRTPHLACPTIVMLLAYSHTPHYSHPTPFTPSGAARGRVHGPAPRQAAARRHEPRRPSPGGHSHFCGGAHIAAKDCPGRPSSEAAAAGRSLRSAHVSAEDCPGRSFRGVGPAVHRPHRHPTGLVAGHGLHRLTQVCGADSWGEEGRVTTHV